MQFCPKCGSLLLPKEDNPKKVKCSCGYNPKQKKIFSISERVENSAKIEVVDKKLETLPTLSINCPKCGYKKAFYWLVQTRASDEAETQFFRCMKCSHQWRQY
ncbi:MAG: transcription factor S [Nanoarchaeota archaeon]|nr:transcription factor S [Nanoarchaeota archaeon]